MQTRYYELMVFFYVLTHEFMQKLANKDVPLLMRNDSTQGMLGGKNTGFASPVACFLDLFQKAAEGGVLNPHESYRDQFWKLFYQYFGEECGTEGQFALDQFESSVHFENDNWWCRVIHQAHGSWWGRLLAQFPGYAAPRVYTSHHSPVVHAYRYVPEMSRVRFYHFHIDGRILDLHTSKAVRTIPGIPKALQEHLKALRECFHDASTAHGDWISPEYFQAMARQLFLVYTGSYVQCEFHWDSTKERYRMCGVVPQDFDNVVKA